MIASAAVGLVALALIAWVLWQAPRRTSLREDERALREYFLKKDAAEGRGERFPP